MKAMGIVCSRSSPCKICTKWDDETWRNLGNAIREKENRKAAKFTGSESSSHTESTFKSPQAKKSPSGNKKSEGMWRCVKQTSILLFSWRLQPTLEA